MKFKLLLLLSASVCGLSSVWAGTVHRLCGGNVGIGFCQDDKIITHTIQVEVPPNSPDGTPIPNGTYHIHLRITSNGVTSDWGNIALVFSSGVVTSVSPATINAGDVYGGPSGTQGRLFADTSDIPGFPSAYGSITDNQVVRQAATSEEFWAAWPTRDTPVSDTVTFSVFPTPDSNKIKCNDPTSGCNTCASNDHGMASYTVHSMNVNLHISDTPVGYQPPVGLAVYFQASYNHRETNQPSSFTYGNLGSKWTFNWLSYVTDDPANATANAAVYVSGGGAEVFTNFNSTTQSYDPDPQSFATLVRLSATSYEKRFSDGSKQIFSLPDGSAVYPRKVFMTQVVDPAGNATVLAYDTSFRLTTITDAIGQVTAFTYGLGTDNLKITKVTDPFGRFALFEYNGSNQLFKITDVIGIVSQFTYADGTDFINKLTTPYGDTLFAKGDDDARRWIEVTDANGGKERVELRNNAPGIGATEVSAPAGVGNANLQYANTFYWSKKAMMTAPGDYTKAEVTHWLSSADGNTLSGIAASTKSALESRVWYQYAGQTDFNRVGSNAVPTRISRILDDGTTQSHQYESNVQGKYTRTIDPLGRAVSFIYATNNIDLLEVRQTTGTNNELHSSATYNAQHLPLTLTDAAAKTTTVTYNARGQILTVTNAKNETTTRSFDTNGYLQSITGPLAGATSSFTYDGYGRVRTTADSQSYTLTYDYDALDRPTKVTFPDTTYTQNTYDRLDVGTSRDRLGRITTYNHDAVRHTTSAVDPLNRTTTYNWCICGALDSLLDAGNQTTTWTRDLQSRVTAKTYANNTSIQYQYENTTSRLKKATDAKGQLTNLSYYLDNNLQQVSYTDVNGQPLNPPTPGVNYTYDANYNRALTMTDGTGVTTYAYNPIAAPPALGAGRLATIDGPLANDTISYGYDELGRVLHRSINGGANASSMIYDSLGRISSATNPLGAFNYNYVSVTGRLSSVSYPGGQSTAFTYFDNTGDQRLQQIKNLNSTAGVISQFDYTYNAVGNIATWTQNNSGLTNAQRYDLSYDAADQLKEAILKNATSGAEIKPYLYGYDSASNRTSEQVDTNVTGSSYNNVNQLTSRTAGGSLRFKGTISEPGTVTVGGAAATVDAGLNFTGNAAVATGSNTVPVVATDTAGNARTNNYQVTVPALNQTLGYDLNGSMLNDGNGKTYEWDAANRLVAINSGTHRSEFTYDGQTRRVKTIEKDNGSVTSTKQFVWCPGDAQSSEERDGSNNVTKRFYAQGEQIGGASYYYAKDHLVSIREMTDGTGAVRARYDYDPCGRLTKMSGDLDSDFTYAGYYNHSPSGLYATLYRFYSPDLGRWLSPDPIGEAGGINLYGYVGNDPVNAMDPLGLDALFLIGGNKINPGYFDSKVKNAARAYEATHPGKNAYIIQVRSFEDVSTALANTLNIDRLDYWGHGGEDALYLSIDELDVRKSNVNQLPTQNITSDAQINLVACRTASLGERSIAQKFADHFNRPVSGFTTGVSFGKWGVFMTDYPRGDAQTRMPGQKGNGTSTSTFPFGL